MEDDVPTIRCEEQTASTPGGKDLGELVHLFYRELRALSRSQHRRNGAADTICTTALVNEAYLRLAEIEGLRFGEPRQFFAYAARAMRHILLDRARSRLRAKRGGDQLRVSLTSPAVEEVSIDPQLALDLDEALTLLEQEDPRAAQVVELHFFAGLTLERVAELLGVVRRTVDRDWQFARAFLLSNLD